MTGLIVQCVVKVSLIVAAAAAVNASWLRRKSAASRHLVWAVAASSLLALPVLSALLPAWVLPIRVSSASARPTGSSSVRAMPNAEGVESRAPLFGNASPVAPENGPNSTDERSGWVVLLPSAYAAGALLLLIRLLAQHAATARVLRQASDVCTPEWMDLLRDCRGCLGVRRRVRLIRSRQHLMPMAVGVVRPAIVIPAFADMWSEDRRRAVLLHELAHIARQDCLTQAVAAAACALNWLHPGVWWIARRLRIERELACDDCVLSAGTEAHDYAAQLLELAYANGGDRAPALAVSMARRQHIEGRLRAVLDRARNRSVPAPAVRSAALVATAVLLIPLAAVEAALRPVSVVETASPGVLPQADADPKTNAIDERPGTWSVRPGSPGAIELTLAETGHSFHGTIAVDRLDGLSPSILAGPAVSRVQFSLRRDAGILSFEGSVRSGVGAGTLTFSPSPAFRAELVRRGFESPSADEQFTLARNNIGYAFLDELTAQGYAKPTMSALVRAAEHGVRFENLREMGRLGYRVGRIDTFVTLVDHGVSPEFVRKLGAEGLSGLSSDDLVRARDHGVSPEYVKDLRALGYGPLALDALVRARDHGISPQYVRDLRDLGHRLTLDGLIKARDHGVSAEYVRDMASLGYSPLSQDDLVRLRDHGVSPEYARRLQGLGYRLSLDELLQARNHGVDPDEIRDLAQAGYQKLSFADLVRLREHGISPEYARQLQRQGRGRTVDELIRLRDKGVSSDRLSDLHRAFHDMTIAMRDRIRSLIERWGSRS